MRIPEPDWFGLHLYGRHGEDRGSRRITPSDTQPVRLVLKPDSVVRIQVVDEQGRPRAGVPVCLALHKQSPYSETNCTPTLWTSGPDGIAKAHRIQDVLKSLGYRPGAQMRFSAHLALPLAAPVEAVIDPDSLPVDPVQLVLPPTGSVRFELLERSAEKGEIVLALLGLREDPFWSSRFTYPYPGGYYLFPAPERFQDGVARFPHVGLGLELQARVVRSSATGCREGAPLKQTGPGPAAPGQEVVFRFEAPPPIPVLSGRIVDAQGSPLGERWFFFTLSEYKPTDSRPNFRTDDTGRFRLPLHRHTRKARLVVIDLEGGSNPPLGGSKGFSIPSPGKGTDLGDVRLEALPLVAGGTVVDQEGKPLPGVSVSIHGRLPAVDFEGTFSLRTRSDTEGRFWLYYPLEPCEYQIMAVSPGYATGKQQAVVGAHEICFVLGGQAGLEGSLLLPEGADADRFKVILDRLVMGKMQSDGLHLSVDREGRFSRKRANPGLISLRIELALFGRRTIHRVDGFLLEADKVNRDPRLQQIDLRDKVQVVELELVDTLGLPVSGARLAARLGGEQRFKDLSPDRDLLPPGNHEILISAPGYRQTVIKVPPSRQMIVLQKGLDVRLGLEPPLPLLEPGFEVMFVLHRQGSQGLPDILERAGDIRNAVAFCLGPGQYDVIVRISHATESISGERHRSSTGLRATDPAWIEVEERPGPQVFPLRLDLEALSRAMEGMKAEQQSR